MPFVAPKSSTSSSNAGSKVNGPGGGGRTTFRPPWVKEDGGVALKPTAKTTVPWAKKTVSEKENGIKPTPILQGSRKSNDTGTKTAANTKENTANEVKNSAEHVKKTVEQPAKKVTEPAKKLSEPIKKAVEPAKKIVTSVRPSQQLTKKTPAPALQASQKTSAAGTRKKEPTPSSSSEEEEEEEEEESEEETEEETEEEESEEEESESDEDDDDETTKKEKDKEVPTLVVKPPIRKPQSTATSQATTKKEEEESELKRRFSIEKPKLRPVVVKRDKSMKKIIDDDEDTVEGETEEERERRLRFKLEKPKLRHVKREEKPLPSKSSENVLKIRPVLKKVPKVDEISKENKEETPEFKTKTLRKTPSIKRETSRVNVPAPPPLPSLVPKAPPPPPGGEKRQLTETHKAALEKLRTRPRRRPDWSEMMKEVEDGKKLRHVECNDRSQPILTCKSMTKVDDKFIYETEKENSHNKLLKQIQSGVRLRPTQTNDRSRPILDGLRKFRRQMTIEEQLQKSQSKINMLGEVPGGAASSDGSETNAILAALSIDDPSGDELDDIDKIRDDLQSTKQMLALELRQREAQERENKKLLAKIATLEAELAREKSREKNFEYGSNVVVATMETTPATEEAFVTTLKKEAEDARKSGKELEEKYQITGELLDQAKIEIEEQKRQIQLLERKLAHALQGGGSLNGSRRSSDVHTGHDSSPDFNEITESDPDEPEEKKKERHERKLAKEVKILRSKLTKLKVKQEAAKKEKDALKQAMKKNHVILKEENKKFKKLEKEVQKMAASMKVGEDDDDDEDEDIDKNEEAEEKEEEADEEEEESDEESEDSESESSEPATESESEAEDASSSDKKDNLEPRTKKHDSRLSAMKKCNVLLQANVDNLQDEIMQVRSKAQSLQSELDAVLQDLGF